MGSLSPFVKWAVPKVRYPLVPMCTVSSVLPYHGNENGRTTSTHPSSAFCIQVSTSVPVEEISNAYESTLKSRQLRSEKSPVGATGWGAVVQVAGT